MRTSAGVHEKDLVEQRGQHHGEYVCECGDHSVGTSRSSPAIDCHCGQSSSNIASTVSCHYTNERFTFSITEDVDKTQGVRTSDW